MVERLQRELLSAVMTVSLVTACAHAQAGGRATPEDRPVLGPQGSAAKPSRFGAKVARSALWHLENRPQTTRSDCSGLVESILARVGVGARGGSGSFWKAAKRDGRLAKTPRPGDLAFFDRTYDSNGNGRVDDELTHVAVVTHVDDDGTVTMVHRGSGKIRILRLSLTHPGERKVDGKVVNDYLRAPKYGGPKDPRLAGQLLRGFARPPRTATHVSTR